MFGLQLTHAHTHTHTHTHTPGLAYDSLSDTTNSVKCVYNLARLLSPAGRWREVHSFEAMQERALFETFTGGYLLAEDNGYFSVGEPRKDG